MAGYTITINGLAIKCDGPQDVLALIEATASQPKAPRKRPSTNGVSKADTRAREKLIASIALLKAIQKAGNAGTNADALMTACGKKGTTRAIGGPFAALNKRLKALRFKVDEVYVTERTDNGSRWSRKKKIGEAIEALEGKGAA